jgi:hypothetical protein
MMKKTQIIISILLFCTTILLAETTQRVFHNPPKSTLNVALMLPLYLNEVDQIRVTPRMNQHNVRAFRFITFYQGAMLAAQNFEHSNVKINVNVFDVTDDESTAVRLINSGRLNNMDIIVGPLFARSFRVMSDFAKQHEIFIVNPLSDRDDILDENPFVIKINTSERNQLQTLLNFVAEENIGQRILVLSNDSLPNERERSRATKLFFGFSEHNFDTVIFIDFSKERFSKLQSSLSNVKNNAIIYLSNDEAFVTQILTRIPKRETGANILYSLQKLSRFEVTDPVYLNNLQTHYIEPFFINHDDENVRNFELLFFENFQTIPDAMAYKGYDVMSFVFELLKKGNTNYGNYLKAILFEGFHNQIQLYRSDPHQGLENRSTNILKIENSLLRKVNN